jgi:hypothetical protein
MNKKAADVPKPFGPGFAWFGGNGINHGRGSHAAF